MKYMISNHIVSSGILSPPFSPCMVYCHEGGLEIEHCTTQIIVARNFWFICFISLLLIFMFPSFQILSLPLLILYSLSSLSSPSTLSPPSLHPLLSFLLSSPSTLFPPSPHPLLSFLPLLVLYSLSSLSSSSTLFPPSPRLYSLSSLSYHFPLFPDLAEPEVLLPSFRTQILPFGIGATSLNSESVVYMHLCIHPFFPRVVLVSHLKLVHIKATSSEPHLSLADV